MRMRAYRTGRGRKKAVKEFRIRNGLWIIAVVLGGYCAIMLLSHFGFLNFDHH
jgi:hypothetical protein